jgi:fructan beta-fructosidase
MKRAREITYQEKHRPQFHFTSWRGWLNDPNGLVYDRGEYHLFYQHNPHGCTWGDIHWGHAVSQDLVHWQELPDALHPDDMGLMFSGSALVDWRNSSGLARGEGHTLVCFYTAAGEFADPPLPYTQCMAFSHDRGRTWHKYAGNPVLEHVAGHNRDPKVLWHELLGQWVMVLYLRQAGAEQHYGLYTSPDLKNWSPLDDVYLPGNGECPDLFPLSMDGDVKWVFWGADGHYFVGTFDGNAFEPQTPPLQAYCGGRERGSAYAAQTWSDIPVEDGRRVQMAWLQGDIPGMPFDQQMSFPVELTLRATPQGPRLHFTPVQEIERLYQETQTLTDVALSQEPLQLPTGGHDLLDMRADVVVSTATALEFDLRGVPLVYDARRQELSCCGKTAPLKTDKLQLRVLVDRTSIEIFAAGGLVYMPLGVIADEDHRTCYVSARGGKARGAKIEIARLNSIWT